MFAGFWLGGLGEKKTLCSNYAMALGASLCA